ncbi:hypothetical protein [Hasllibacter sp. MH4015]|uniref:hypothetical protein n=1 Tax=Hasllibacter sp. MH4015 TaxID=2854029 RepID=UPI001CD2783E|nr:hypothetical protein [Hasllibacter sp. MH4015]
MATSCAVALALMPWAAFAQAQGEASGAVAAAEACLELGDAAFEQSLTDTLDPSDVEALEQVYSTATFECLGLAMAICEREVDGAACLVDLADWMRGARADIVAQVPDALENEDAAQVAAYGEAQARAASPADEADCAHMGEEDRARYCAVVSEGMALEDAYAVWRMARRDGAVPLEGHGPIDLELIR